MAVDTSRVNTSAAKRKAANQTRPTKATGESKRKKNGVTATPGYSIVRVDMLNAAGNPVQYWLVSIKRQGKEITRQFFDGVYGSELDAWQMAMAYRDAVMRLFPPRTLKDQNTKPRANNTSGTPGVRALVKQGKEVAWIATLDTVTQRYRKYFAVRDYGYERAKELAIAAREQMLGEYANRFATVNPEATASANQQFSELLSASSDEHDRSGVHPVDDATFLKRQEVLNAWFDSLRPQHVNVRVEVYFILRRDSDGLFLTISGAGPSSQRKHKVWSLLPRNYQECLPLVWDVIKTTLIERIGTDNWHQFQERNHSKFMASTAKVGFYARHYIAPPGAAIMRTMPPQALLPMLEGFVVPPLLNSSN